MKISALVSGSCHAQIQSIPGRIFQLSSIKKNRPGTEANSGVACPLFFYTYYYSREWKFNDIHSKPPNLRIKYIRS